MPKMNYADRIRNIQRHIETINGEMGSVQKEITDIKIDIAVIKTNWNMVKWFTGVSVPIWVIVLGKIIGVY